MLQEEEGINDFSKEILYRFRSMEMKKLTYRFLQKIERGIQEKAKNVSEY